MTSASAGATNTFSYKYSSTGVDFGVALLLACVYSITPGFQYTTGLLQTAWLEEGILTPSVASLINSLTFTLTCIPAPFLQRALDRCGLKPYTIAALALPLLITGSIWSTYSTTSASLLITNGIMVGFGCCIQLISCWGGLYYMFTDSQIYLFNGFMVAGAGLGIVPISLLFLFVEPNHGWRATQRLTAVMYVNLILFAIILFPPVRKFLGIKTRVEKLEYLDAMSTDSNSEHSIQNSYQEPRCDDIPETHEQDSIDSYYDEDPQHEEVPVSLIALTSLRSISMQQPGPVSENDEGPLKYVFTNTGYILSMISFIITAQTYDTIMVHQPVRMTSLGIKASNGAFALVINGSIQAVMRVTVGVLTSKNIISPIRLSQIGKIMFFVTTAVSLYVTNSYYQTTYFFMLGFGGAILNTADFFLAKETLKKHRDFAIIMELSIAGVLTLFSMTFVGYMYQHYGNYDLAFQLLTVLFLIGLIPSFVYEIHMKRKSRLHRERYGYSRIN